MKSFIQAVGAVGAVFVLIAPNMAIAQSDVTETETSAPAASPELAGEETAQMMDHMSCKPGPRQIQIRVRNVAESVGLMTADLYRNDEEGFLRMAGRIDQVRFAAKSPITEFCMPAPGEGVYAIAIYHDENANMSFDKKAFGLPAEPYGISNNPVIRFAPPSVSDALFTVAEDGAIVDISLRNN